MKYQYRHKKTGTTCVLNKIQVFIFSPEKGDSLWYDVPGTSFYDEKEFDVKFKKFLSIDSDHPFKLELSQSGVLSNYIDGINIPYRVVKKPWMKGGLIQVNVNGFYETVVGDFDDACFKVALERFLEQNL